MDVVVMRLHTCSQEDDSSPETTKDDYFLREHEILMKHKHKNIIDLVGYCREGNEKIIVYGLASVGTLEVHLSSVTLGWVERLKISIDVANALEFLHESVQVIHRDFKSASILLGSDWRARIFEFAVCSAAPLNKIIYEYDIDDVFGTPGYYDLSYWGMDILTKESDIYALGVVLFEIMCGKKLETHNKEGQFVDDSVKQYFEERRLDEIVFECLKKEMVPHSLGTFQTIAYQCLHHERQKRPTVADVVLQLKKALEFQMEHSYAGGMGSFSIQEQIRNFIRDKDDNNGVRDEKKPNHFSFNATQDPKFALTGSPDSGSTEKSYITGLLLEIEELKDENRKRKRYQQELEAQLEAERAQTTKLKERMMDMEAREAEREVKV